MVIGSGFGGLAAAVRLGARGYRVTIFEKLDAPGGRAIVHRQDGFTFDAGPTIVTAPFLFEELWALCGRRMADEVELRAMIPSIKFAFDNGDVFTLAATKRRCGPRSRDSIPRDVEGYERFMRRSEAIYRIGFEQLGDEPFNSFTGHGAHRRPISSGWKAIAASTAWCRNISATSGCARSSAFIRC